MELHWAAYLDNQEKMAVNLLLLQDKSTLVGEKMAERVVWKLKMKNLEEAEEHLHVLVHCSCFEEEIP